MFGNSCLWKTILQCLEEAEQQAEASGDVPPPPLQIVIAIPVLSLSHFPLFSLCSLSQSSLFPLHSFPLASPPLVYGSSALPSSCLLLLCINFAASQFSRLTRTNGCNDRDKICARFRRYCCCFVNCVKTFRL